MRPALVLDRTDATGGEALSGRRLHLPRRLLASAFSIPSVVSLLAEPGQDLSLADAIDSCFLDGVALTFAAGQEIVFGNGLLSVDKLEAAARG